jgi:hypothetical protein
MPRDTERAYDTIRRLAEAKGPSFEMTLEAATVVLERFAMAFSEDRLRGSDDIDRALYHAAIDVVTRSGH